MNHQLIDCAWFWHCVFPSSLHFYERTIDTRDTRIDKTFSIVEHFASLVNAIDSSTILFCTNLFSSLEKRKLKSISINYDSTRFVFKYLDCSWFANCIDNPKPILIIRQRIFHETLSLFSARAQLHCVSEWSKQWVIDEKCGYFPQSSFPISPTTKRKIALTFWWFPYIVLMLCFLYFLPFNKLFFIAFPEITLCGWRVMCDNNKERQKSY